MNNQINFGTADLIALVGLPMESGETLREITILLTAMDLKQVKLLDGITKKFFIDFLLKLNEKVLISISNKVAGK